MSIILVPKSTKRRLWQAIEQGRLDGWFPEPRNTPDRWRGFPEAHMIERLLDKIERPPDPLPIEQDVRQPGDIW